FHQGVDGIGGYNTAPEDGRVIGYSYAGGWGNRIVFAGVSGTIHYLAHNAPGGLLVPVGSYHKEGTALGIKGMTGTATGVHVHWEPRPSGGAPINPEVWLSSQTSPAGGDAAIIEEGEIDMSEPRYVHKKEKGVEYMVIGEDVPGGWYASTNIKDGEAYGIL